MVGSTLGQYRSLEKIGVGGMGEVYRAENPNPGREVAIKVLPEDLAPDPERLGVLLSSNLLRAAPGRRTTLVANLRHHTDPNFSMQETPE